MRPRGRRHGNGVCLNLAHEESFTTIDFAIHFPRPVWQSLLRAEAHIINRGKTVGYVECEVTDQDGKPVAKATATCFILRGDQAKDR